MKKFYLVGCLLLITVALIISCVPRVVPVPTPVTYQPDFPLPVKITTQSPEEINRLMPTEVWDGLLKMGISNFYHRADTYHWDPWCAESGTELSKECQVVYGVLAPEDFWGYVPRDYWHCDPFCDPGRPNTNLNDTLFGIMESESLLKIAYAWLKPYYQQTFRQLTPESQQIYLEALAHAKNYLQHFDYAKELAYLRQLQEQNLAELIKDDATATYDQETLTSGFAYQGPDGSEKFRKVEAFIFRRVHNEQMSVEQMLAWANTLEQDFAPLARGKKTLPNE